MVREAGVFDAFDVFVHDVAVNAMPTLVSGILANLRFTPAGQAVRVYG
jgi:hypothetical protein